MLLSTIAEAEDEAFDRQVAVNLKGVFNGLREAAKRLRTGGRIISLSSSVVLRSPPTYALYAATKAGVEAMTHILSKELRGRNITVNAIGAGPTATDLFLKGKSQNLIDELKKMAPLERLGEPTISCGRVVPRRPDGLGQRARGANNGGMIDRKLAGNCEAQYIERAEPTHEQDHRHHRCFERIWSRRGHCPTPIRAHCWTPPMRETTGQRAQRQMCAYARKQSRPAPIELMSSRSL
jgi:hypothetical protein